MENGEARQKLEEKRATDQRARSGVQPFLDNCPEKMPSRMPKEVQGLGAPDCQDRTL